MNILRHIGAFIAGSILTFSLFTLVFVVGFLRVATQPDKVKSIIKDSGIYSSAVSGVIEESLKEQAKDQSGEEKLEDIPLDRPEIKAAAEKAFTPEFLQTSTEQFIDGTYRWLDGEVEKPDFSIDLSDAKDTLFDNIVTYAKERTETLPACEPGEIPEEVDIFNAECVPAGFNIDSEIARVRSDLDNGEFLEDTTLTADDIGKKEGQPAGATFTDNLAQLPRAYQNIQLAPLFLAGLAALAALMIIFASVTKRKGMRRVAITLVAAGLILLIGTVALDAGLSRAQNAAIGSEDVGAFKDNIVRFSNGVAKEIKEPYLMYGGIYAGLGALIILLQLFVFKSHGSKVIKTVKPEHSEIGELPIPEEAGSELPEQNPVTADKADVADDNPAKSDKPKS